jgi:hypothetical protein
LSGHVKRAGRKKGTPNKLTREIKDAIVGAAEELGSNGKGKGGLQGFMKSPSPRTAKGTVAIGTWPHPILSIVRPTTSGPANWPRLLAC